MKQADAQAAVERARIANLEQTWSASLCSRNRPLCAGLRSRRTARNGKQRARPCLARAACGGACGGSGGCASDALVWPKAHASYSGETRNRQPHGFGVIVFREGGGETHATPAHSRTASARAMALRRPMAGMSGPASGARTKRAASASSKLPTARRFEGEVAPDEARRAAAGARLDVGPERPRNRPGCDRIAPLPPPCPRRQPPAADSRKKSPKALANRAGLILKESLKYWSSHAGGRLDRTFHALSDPTRRAMVQRLARGPASVSELAKPLSISLPAVMQHLQVLEASGS